MEQVKIKSYEEIKKTLDTKGTTHGTHFLSSMKSMCGKTLDVKNTEYDDVEKFTRTRVYTEDHTDWWNFVPEWIDTTPEFEVGDKIRIKNWVAIAKTLNDAQYYDINNGQKLYFNDDMLQYCGKEMTITSIKENGTRIDVDGTMYTFTPAWVELVSKRSYSLSDFDKRSKAYKTAISQINKTLKFDKDGNIVE